jgi:hypothetical protein
VGVVVAEHAELLRRLESTADALAERVRDGDVVAAASLDVTLVADLHHVLASVRRDGAGANDALAATLARIRLVYDVAAREIASARDRIAAELVEAQQARRNIGCYLDVATS